MTQAKKDNTTESIIAHYMDERAIKLTPVQNKKRQMCEAAFTMMIGHDSITKVVQKLQGLYKIDKSTAYRIIHMSEAIFGNVKKFNKDAWRFIQVERKRRLITELTKQNRWDLVVKLEEQIDKIIGFDKDDLSFDPDKIKSQTYEINISDVMKRALMKAIGKGPIDMNNLEVEDIPHEELTDPKESH